MYISEIVRFSANFARLVEDLDQDGHVDLVVLNRDDDDVSILRGRGDGTFHTEVRFGCGASPRDFAVADMNGDGTRDLVIANGAGSSVSVLLAIGDGTFQPDIIAPTSAQLFSLAVADFNNDGKQDVATGSTDKVLTLLGNGDGTLAPPATTMVSTGAVNDLVASDMGGSVGPDIASASAQAQSASLDILVRSDGAFTNELAFFLRDGRARRLALRTLDGDTLADIVALNDKDVSIFRSTTSNLFSYEARFRIAAGSDFAIADADGDGDLDIFTSGGTSIWVLLNQTF